MSATVPAVEAANHPVAAAAVAPAVGPAAARAWDIDPAHSSANFKVRHLMVSHVRGELGTVTGTILIDDRHVEQSRIDVSIDARQIASRDEKRDAHLRSADFLDVDHHPTVTFHSTRVDNGSGDHLRVTGDLVIRGNARPVVLDVDPLPPAVADPWGNTRRGATARARINRKDWGLQWNLALEAGGVVVGDEVAIEIEVELVKQRG